MPECLSEEEHEIIAIMQRMTARYESAAVSVWNALPLIQDSLRKIKEEQMETDRILGEIAKRRECEVSATKNG